MAHFDSYRGNLTATTLPTISHVRHALDHGRFERWTRLATSQWHVSAQPPRDGFATTAALHSATGLDGRGATHQGLERLGPFRDRQMERITILGPGAAGKSTLAAKIGSLTGIPVTDLDTLFWRPGLLPTPRNEWTDAQRALVSQRRWILDGDLGPYDAVEVRLQAADTVILLDYSILRCAWRAMRRSRERTDFWLWLLQYRRRSRPRLLKAISAHAPLATVHRFRNPKATDRFVAGLARARRRE